MGSTFFFCLSHHCDILALELYLRYLRRHFNDARVSRKSLPTVRVSEIDLDTSLITTNSDSKNRATSEIMECDEVAPDAVGFGHAERRVGGESKPASRNLNNLRLSLDDDHASERKFSPEKSPPYRPMVSQANHPLGRGQMVDC